MIDFPFTMGRILTVAAGLFVFSNSVIVGSCLPKTFATKILLTSQYVIGGILVLFPVFQVIL